MIQPKEALKDLGFIRAKCLETCTLLHHGSPTKQTSNTEIFVCLLFPPCLGPRAAVVILQFDISLELHSVIPSGGE